MRRTCDLDLQLCSYGFGSLGKGTFNTTRTVARSWLRAGLRYIVLHMSRTSGSLMKTTDSFMALPVATACHKRRGNFAPSLKLTNYKHATMIWLPQRRRALKACSLLIDRGAAAPLDLTRTVESDSGTRNDPSRDSPSRAAPKLPSGRS
jgi:hypothetical protein